MPPQSSALLIHEIVPLREEVANQRAFSQSRTLPNLLTLLGNDVASKDDALARLCIVKVLHQSEVVQVTSDSAANVARFADVERFELRAPASTENIHSGPTGD